MAAISKTIPSIHNAPNNEPAASGSAAGTLRRRQLYKLRTARKTVPTSGGQIAGVKM